MVDLQPDEDDTPWASPEIQKNYEAALGRFILAFNRMDNMLSEVLLMALRRLNRPDLLQACVSRGVPEKLLALELLQAAGEGSRLESLPANAIKQVSAERNVLVHGHFDQNPFDGSYDIVTRKRRADYPVEKLDLLTQRAAEASDALNLCVARYSFEPRGLPGSEEPSKV
jgi:hypothetical protein